MAAKPPIDLSGMSLDSDEVRDAIHSFALDVIAGMRRMFDMGDPTLRMQIGKAFMPLLVKAMSKDQESEDIAELKKQMTAMHEVIANGPTRLRVVNGEPIMEDEPPGQ